MLPNLASASLTVTNFAVGPLKVLSASGLFANAVFTFAAITLRIQMPLLMLFIDVDVAYVIVAWACWILNLILVEIYLHRKQRQINRPLTD